MSIQKLVFGLLVAMASISGLQAADQKTKEEVLTFEREKMSVFDGGGRVEGYWTTIKLVFNDKGRWVDSKIDPNCKYPFPKPHKNPWPTQKEFLTKLYKIESCAGDGNSNSSSRSRVLCFRMKGLSPSRLEPRKNVSGNEYCDTHENISWPAGFSWYYVAKFNVKPSREFYDYVMNHSLAQDDQIQSKL